MVAAAISSVAISGTAWRPLSLLGRLVGSGDALADGATRSPAPLLERVRAVGDLEVLRLELSDVRESRVAGWLGEARLLLVARCHASIGVDLTRAEVTADVNGTDGRGNVTLVLPTPAVTQVGLDPAHTRVYRVERSGLWELNPQDAPVVELTRLALIDAGRAAARAADDPRHRVTARAQAERLLAALLTAAGARQVTIRWADAPNAAPRAPPTDPPTRPV